MDFMCLTRIDTAMSWFEIVELPNKDTTYIQDKEKEEIKEVIIDKSLACIARLFNKSWLSCYPRAVSIVYDNGRELSYSLKTCVDLFS